MLQWQNCVYDLEGQNSIASMFSFLYQQKLKAAKVEDIENSVGKILKSYQHDFTGNLESETRSFVTEFKPEIIKKQTIPNLLQLLYDYRLTSSFPVTETFHFVFDYSSYRGECWEVVIQIKTYKNLPPK